MKQLASKVKRQLSAASPAHTMRKLATKRIIERFGDELGMVYFGYVDQRDDEHRLVRGITTSSSHGDHHYTVGTYKTYDISLVVRHDGIEYSDRRITDHYWTIMTFDLKTPYELPHLHIAYHKRKDLFAAKYLQLSEQSRHLFAGHEPRFFDLYSIFGSMARTPEIVALITPQMTSGILQTFSDLSVELSENTLYVYFTSRYPTRADLERMLRSGIWLAQSLDARANDMYRRI